MAKTKTLHVGGWKLIFMLLITWLTPFSGLGNLIFLWHDPHYRRRAIIALAVSVGIGLIPYAVTGAVHGWTFSHVFQVAHLGMDIWMTFDAIIVYKLCRAARTVSPTSVATKAATTKTTRRETKESTKRRPRSRK